MAVSSEASNSCIEDTVTAPKTKVRGKIKISWRQAIQNVLSEWRDYALKSAVVASAPSIIRMLQGFILQGFILWIAFGSVLFALHISENARILRKESRKQSPSISLTEKDK